MWRPLAPTAMRMPISRVRSVTDTSRMFMMPMPPTSSEIAATLSRRLVITWLARLRGAREVFEVANREVVLLAGLDAVALAQHGA